jgi:hypothetical protein
MPVTGHPRTDPNVPDSGIRLLPWVFDSEPLVRPWMKDPRRWQPSRRKPRHPLPRHVILLTAPLQRTPPDIGDMVPGRVERPGVRGHGVVREEPRDHRLQPSALFGNGVMNAATQLCLDLPKRRPHAVSSGSALKLERPAPGLAAYEREPQEGKGLRFAKPSPLAPGRRQAAELQQARLLLVKFERKLLEPRSHRIPEAPRIGFALPRTRRRDIGPYFAGVVPASGASKTHARETSRSKTTASGCQHQ